MKTIINSPEHVHGDGDDSGDGNVFTEEKSQLVKILMKSSYWSLVIPH